MTSPVPAPSVLVHRPKTHRGRGAVSSAMTYLPGRYLRGLLPEALLRCYEFWQHSDGAIEGEARGAAAAAAAATAKKKRNPSATGGNGTLRQAWRNKRMQARMKMAVGGADAAAAAASPSRSFLYC